MDYQLPVRVRIPAGFRATIGGVPHRYETTTSSELIFVSEDTNRANVIPHHEYWERHSKGEIKEIIRFARNSPLFSREALTAVHLLAIPTERFPEYEKRLAYAKALKNAPRGRRSEMG